MKHDKKREEIANQRLQIIQPLLNPELDPAERRELFSQISAESGLSVRTLQRYESAYQKKGWQGLKPNYVQSAASGKCTAAYREAEQLRLEVPGRSVADIIRILEMEGLVKEGFLKRSTLQDHFEKVGLSARQMRTQKMTGSASRRFQKQHRCQLFQGDIKFGPILPIGAQGRREQLYLSVIIDDATRYVAAAKFYTRQTTDIIEDTLRNAIMRFGLPDAFYFDNGKQYRNRWIQRICAMLGIRLLYAKPYSPESKGKVEAFNRTVESLFAEIALENPKSLQEANELLNIWISEHYHKRPHSALNGKTPELVFQSDRRALNFPDIEVMKDAFLHSEERNVDKTGCFKLHGKQYEAGLEYALKKVDVYFDPQYSDEVEIRHEGYAPKRVCILHIDEFCCAAKPPAPQIETAKKSRLLAGLKKQSEKRHAVPGTILDFHDYYMEDSDD